MWADALLNKFFPIVDTRLNYEEPDKVVRWCPDGSFCVLYFSASRVQQVSDLHLKFAPHHAWEYGRHPIYDG